MFCWRLRWARTKASLRVPLAGIYKPDAFLPDGLLPTEAVAAKATTVPVG